MMDVSNFFYKSSCKKTTKERCNLRLTEEYLRNKDMPYLKINKIFYELQKYKNSMKSWDREIYAYCRDRISLSLKNKWFNKNGEIYFKANQEKLAKYIGVSRKTVNESFKKLISLGLLEVEKGAGIKNENIYILCEIPELVRENLNVIESDSKCNSELQLELNVTDSYMSKTNLMYLSILSNTYNKKEAEKILFIFGSNNFSENLKKAVVDYVEDRNERNTRMTVKALEVLIKRIVSIGNQEYAVKLLEESIINGWKNIFPEKGGNRNYHELTEEDFEKFSKGGWNL